MLSSQGKASSDSVAPPTYRACWVFQCFHNPPNSDMHYGIFNVHTNENARDCTSGCTDNVTESALKVDSGEKSLAAPGNRTCVGDVPVRYSSN